MKSTARELANAKTQGATSKVINDLEQKSIRCEAQFDLVSQTAENTLEIKDGQKLLYENADLVHSTGENFISERNNLSFLSRG